MQAPAPAELAITGPNYSPDLQKKFWLTRQKKLIVATGIVAFILQRSGNFFAHPL